MTDRGEVQNLSAHVAEMTKASSSSSLLLLLLLLLY